MKGLGVLPPTLYVKNALNCVQDKWYTGFKINGGPVARVYQKCRRTTKSLMCGDPVGQGQFLAIF